MADGKRPSNLKKAVEVIVDLVRGEGGAKGKPFPENFPLEEYDTVKNELQKMLRDMDEWKEVICIADY